MRFKELFYILTILGMFISGYVWLAQQTYGAILGRRIYYCFGRKCNKVIYSYYSRLIGTHNSTLGFWMFFILLVLALVRTQLNESSVRYLTSAMFGVSFLGILLSTYLIYIQLFKLSAICSWCMTLAFTILSIFTLLVMNL